MARFNLNGFFDNSRFEDFFARYTGASSAEDKMNGTSSSNMLMGGGGNDSLAGMAGNDTLNGGSGADKLWGGSGNDNLSGGSGSDTLVGGSGSDMLVGGFGADRMDGGNGNDVLLSRSDAGEMVAAQDGKTIIFGAKSAAFKAVNDHPDRWRRRRHLPLRDDGEHQRGDRRQAHQCCWHDR